jgi:hypothetical protein
MPAEIRSLLRWLSLAVLATAACDKSSSDTTKGESGEKKSDEKKSEPEKKAPTPEQPDKLVARCETLAKACGEKDKHQEKIVEECKQAAKQQAEKGCSDKALAAYDCYEREICGKVGKVWALDDFRVLTTRHNKCADERNAAVECVAMSDKAPE